MKKILSMLLTAVMLMTAVNIPISASAANNKNKKPSKVNIKSFKALSTKSVKVSFKKVKKARGYQIKIADNKSFKKAKTIDTKKLTKKIAPLNPGTKYYVKVRAYIKVNGQKVYGNWSKIKSAATKQAKKTIKPTKTTTTTSNPSNDDWEPEEHDYSYIEPEPTQSTTQPTTQPTTLSQEEIETNLETLRHYAEIIKTKVSNGNYYKLNNGENGKQIYSGSWWNDLCENDKWADENLYGDNPAVLSYNRLSWETALEELNGLANDIPFGMYTRGATIYPETRVNLDRYPMLREFFRSNPANITDDMTDIEKLEAIARYISEHGIVVSSEDRYGVNNQETYFGLVDYPDEADGELISEAYRILLLDGKGVCKDFSNTCSIWAGYYDIYCVGVCSSDMNHQWNRAILKDENSIEGWYELDPYPGRFQSIYKKSFDIKDNMYREDDAYIPYTNWIYTNK